MQFDTKNGPPIALENMDIHVGRIPGATVTCLPMSRYFTFMESSPRQSRAAGVVRPRRTDTGVDAAVFQRAVT
jgi:hypothetical protein